jgi:hypothetical protein
MVMQNAEQSAVDSYTLVDTGDGTDTYPTTFPFGVTSGDIDLLSSKWGGIGSETKAYRIGMLFTVNGAAGSGTVIVAGASEGGPWEHIASLAIQNAGAVTETGTWDVVDTIDLTNTHIAALNTQVADSGNSRPCKFAFDAVGYRYIKIYNTALTTVTALRTYARIF